MKRIWSVLLLMLSPLAFAKTLQTVAVVPAGAVLQRGSSLQFAATCAYSDGSSDACDAAGGVSWSTTRPSMLAVNTTGAAQVTADPGAGRVQNGYVVATVGGQTARSAVAMQHPGDTWYEYMTPDLRAFKDFSGTVQPMTVAQGATVALGAGVMVGYNGSGGTGTPIQETCNWASSAPEVATVNARGDVTGIAPGTVTITCGRAGDGKFGRSSTAGWQAPGNVLTLTVVRGGVSSATWYVRPDGGTPFVNGRATPDGQCDGQHDAPYPGKGVNQPCAMGNLSYLWLDQQTYGRVAWLIQGGDTVIVRQNPAGYSIGASNAIGRPNCPGDTADCYMPTIPSGTAAQPTRILGENYSSCHADSAKTKLLLTLGEYTAFNLKDSQFVDVSCFEVTDSEQCAYGNFAHGCGGKSKFGALGILSSALTAQDHLTDLFIHGLASGGWLGAVGTGVVADHVHLRGSPSAGINMDDASWGTGNISVAGGFAMLNSTTEFTGCVEEYPVVHDYPYVECRDQNTGGYGDGFGTASTTGDWMFDHDVWRYNFQDGLDLLHSGMRSLTVTNSQSYGNDGQQWKIGSGQTVLFANNLTLHNCKRILQTFGDEPASAIVPGVVACRAAGDGIAMAMSGQGTDTFVGNTFVGYGSTSYDLYCAGGEDTCAGARTTFQNNVNVAISNPRYDQQLPGLFYLEQGGMPAHGGWAVRDHNLFYNFRNGCPKPLGVGEVCADAQFVNEPSLTLQDERSLDSFNFALSGASPAAFAGVAEPALTVTSAGVTVANVLATDQFGTVRPTPPSMGGVEMTAAVPPPGPVASSVTAAATPNPVLAGQTVTLSATVAAVGSTAPTGTVTFTVGTVTMSAALSETGVATAMMTAPDAGSYPVAAQYAGDSNYLPGQAAGVVLTVNAPPVVTPPPPPPTSGVTISVAQPELGFNVLAQSTRRLFATVHNGTTMGVTWTVKSGQAQLKPGNGPWVDVTAPVKGSTCQVTKGAQPSVVSATQFVIEAASIDDPTQVADVVFNVCHPILHVSILPAYRTLYSGQQATLQSLVVGSVPNAVTWAILSGPQGGDGVLTDTTFRDTVFSATVAGRYVVGATSNLDHTTVATSTLYVTGHPLPYAVTPNRTEPVDCTVDPELTGVTYDVGPSQPYRRLQDLQLKWMPVGSTIRLHNEDLTGTAPTTFHEAIQIVTSATATQPVRVCGVPDAKGNLPILDGQDATVHPQVQPTVVGAALLTVGGDPKPVAYPGYNAVQNVVVEGLHLRNARAGLQYAVTRGSDGSWTDSASCLLVRAGHQISVIGVEMEGCATGGQSAWSKTAQWNGSGLNHLWEGNNLHGNGVAQSAAAHQLSLGGWGEVVQFNSISGMVQGGLGDDLRSAGVQDVIRYNYLGDGAAHLLDLTEVGDAAPYLSFARFAAQGDTGTFDGDHVAEWQEALNTDFVYGNSYVNGSTVLPIHFGYDKDGTEVARKGQLFWYNNTFLLTRCPACDRRTWTLFDQSGAAGVFQPQVEFPTVQVWNNVIWAGAGSSFAWNNFDGFLGAAGRNLLPAGWGANTMKGGSGDGWNATPNAAAFQGAEDLATHLGGFTTANLLTVSSAPVSLPNLLLGSDVSAVTAVPSAMCAMPVRWAYLPDSGLVVPRAGARNLGALDTASETAAMGQAPQATAMAPCR